MFVKEVKYFKRADLCSSCVKQLLPHSELSYTYIKGIILWAQPTKPQVKYLFTSFFATGIFQWPKSQEKGLAIKYLPQSKADINYILIPKNVLLLWLHLSLLQMLPDDLKSIALPMRDLHLNSRTLSEINNMK